MSYLLNKKRRVRKFNIDRVEDRQHYEEVINNPLNRIVSKKLEKHTVKSQDSFGNAESEDFAIYVLEWEETTL